MPKTILITGATDGIGLETARLLAGQGETVLLHGRSRAKLDAAAGSLEGAPGQIETFLADLSRRGEVEALADSIIGGHARLDVLINNAGVYRTPQPRTEGGLDTRFAVNSVAPFLLTQRLLPLIGVQGRVVTLSSAAQAPVDLRALAGERQLADMEAYAQSKLALTMWTRHLARTHPEGPVFVAVNPGSLLATRMVREGFGVAGSDVGIGAAILVRAALSAEFADASGKYFDNDAGRFAPPHPDGLDDGRCAEVVRIITALLAAPEGRFR